MSPLLILLVGVVTVIGLILFLRVNAFLALIGAAILVSLLAPGPLDEKISRVAMAFGTTAGKIGIVIALAAIIGKCLMDSGAADRIVRSFLRVLGEKRAPMALMGSGFVLSIPVFFDTVFYLLVPLARSLWRRTHKNYTLYILAIGIGGSITHSLVPPTPGPLFIAAKLNVDIGWMILVGTLIGIPMAIVGLLVAMLMSRFADIPMRPYASGPEPEPLEESRLPGLLVSLLPVLLPVLLISANTVLQSLLETAAAGAPAAGAWQSFLREAAPVTALLGNANFALLLSAVIAMLVLARQRGLSLSELAKTTESALMSGGVIILITAAGGAFGAMLAQADVGKVIEMFAGGGEHAAGMTLLLLGFAVTSVLKIAQGSSTVAMITASGMLAAMGTTPDALGFHPVYLAAAIGCGAMVCPWMNDSGFWIFTRMSVLTESEGLKVWTIPLAIVGISGLGFTMLFAWLLPLV